MQSSADQSQEPGSSSEQPNITTPVPEVDPKIAGLRGLFLCGPLALQAVMFGLSRPFHPTTEDVSALIGQWERRDKNCCYQGSLQDLLSLKDTMILAISYRHAEKKDFYRKGTGSLCKFRTCDEELFKSAVLRLGKDFPKMMVWCDQILSTRLKHDGTTFKWHYIGLLPYMTFTLLYLSTDKSEEKLEERVWIRAERSLGRMALGYVRADETTRNILHAGSGLVGSDCLKNACRHILAGYWPEEKGYWEVDFDLMRKWTLGVLCRKRHDDISDVLFQEHDRVDNTEILSSFGEFASMPFRMRHNEPFILTDDKQFFLKATAWNLSTRGIWEEDTRYISHYMGQLEDMRFSWWLCDKIKTIFGCMTYGAHATTIIATETNTGYKVFRQNGNRLLYVHAEKWAGPNTKQQIQHSAKKIGIDLPEDLEWSLLYCSNDCDLNNFRSIQEVLSAHQGQPAKAEVLVAPVFRGMTTKLFKCAVAKEDGDSREVARRICECFAEWNKYVKNTYTEWMTVRDTTFGPVWLEGFDEESLSFGFLEHLTNVVVLNRQYFSKYSVKLGDAADVEKNVREVSRGMGKNERCLVEQLFSGVGDENDTKISRRDLVRYVLCGGFSKKLESGGLFAFLSSLAVSRKYWKTMVVCRDGVMQIRFGNSEGEKRMAQRRTKLENYSAVGIVHADDYEEVKKISMHYDTSNDKHEMMVYWNEVMEDTTTREEMWRLLKGSRRLFEGSEVLLADMTVGKNEESYLYGKGNVFRHKQDPGLLLEKVRSGEKEEVDNKVFDWFAESEKSVDELVKQLERKGMLT